MSGTLIFLPFQKLTYSTTEMLELAYILLPPPSFIWNPGPLPFSVCFVRAVRNSQFHRDLWVLGQFFFLLLLRFFFLFLLLPLWPSPTSSCPLDWWWILFYCSMVEWGFFWTTLAILSVSNNMENGLQIEARRAPMHMYTQYRRTPSCCLQ